MAKDIDIAKKRIISCAGFGSTGSSAITDLLKEFNTVFSNGDKEYAFLFDSRRIRELEICLNHLNNRQNSNTYIHRFKKYIHKLSTTITKKYYEQTFANQFKRITNEL